MDGHAYFFTYILRPKSENWTIPKLELHLVAKSNGGFWVDNIFLHYTTSTLCVQGHTKISVFKVFRHRGNMWKLAKFSWFSSKIKVSFDLELPPGGSICDNMNQCDIFDAYQSDAKRIGYPGTLRWGYLRVIGVGYNVLPSATWWPNETVDFESRAKLKAMYHGNITCKIICNSLCQKYW